MFTLGTFKFTGTSKFFEKVWILERDSDGGPVVWIENNSGDPVNVFALAADFAATVLQNTVLVSLSLGIARVAT